MTQHLATFNNILFAKGCFSSTKCTKIVLVFGQGLRPRTLLGERRNYPRPSRLWSPSSFLSPQRIRCMVRCFKNDHLATPYPGRRQVKICGVDRHGERGRRTDHPPILPPIKIAGFVSISGATSSKSGAGHVHPSPPRGDATAYIQKLIGLMDVFSTQQRLHVVEKYHMKQSTPKL